MPVASRPPAGVVKLPGSKSQTLRAMAAAALADGRSHLYGALDSDDSHAMRGALEAFGVTVSVDADAWTVDGSAGRLHAARPTIDAGESGLTARIALALAASSDGSLVVSGRGRLPDRPMTGLVEALRSQGVELSDNALPIEVTGHGRLWGGAISVDCSTTSQFATALLLVAPTMQERCTLEIIGLTGSHGYLELTIETMRQFGAIVTPTFTGFEVETDPYRATDLLIEGDASSAAYPLAIAAVTGGTVTVEGLGEETSQPDARVADLLGAMGCRVQRDGRRLTLDAADASIRPLEADLSGLPDGALAVAVVCLFADGPSRLQGLSSLRHKESDRLAALVSEIRKLGGEIEAGPDSLEIVPSPLVGRIVDPHGDHRIAMSLAVAGTRTPGVSVMSPNVVNKTWPGFWGMLDDLVR